MSKVSGYHQGRAHAYVALYADEWEQASLFLAYATFVGSVLCTIMHFGGKVDMSSCLTLGGGLQCLAFTLLFVKVRASNSVAGVSARSLRLYAGSFVARLCSTLSKDGYLPVDPTGDWLYQLADVVSLCIVAQLLYRIHCSNTSSYASELDTLPTRYLAMGCVGLAFFTHGDLNNSWFFDVVWMISFNLDVVAMLPQIFLLSRRGGPVEAMTAHFVAMAFASRLTTAAYWFLGYQDLAPMNVGLNACGYAVVAGQILQLLLQSDFMYQYCQSMCRNKALILPTHI